MSSQRARSSGPLPWLVVAAIGAVVLVVVFGLQLFPRLDDGQEVIDDLRPLYSDERVETARGGVDMVSSIVDLADPLVLQSGGGADEVPQLVAFVAEQTGLSEADVLATLQEQFPHTTGLLTALPLEDVNAEIPDLVAFLAQTLGVSEDDVTATLEDSFPRLNQAVAALPTVAGGWDDVPDTPGTRFNGDQINTVPEVRDYLSLDVVPILERQRENFHKLESTWPPTNVFPPLLTVVGILVVLFGLVMLRATRKAS